MRNNRITSPIEQPQITWSIRLFAGLRVAIIGGVVLSLIECSLIALLLRHHFDDAFNPVPIMLAAVGKAALTQLIVWSLVLAILAVLYGAIRRRAATGAALWWLVMAACSGIAAVPAVARITHEKSHGFHTKAYVLVAVLALGGFLVIALARRMLRPITVRRLVNALTTVAGIFIAICGFHFVRSPLFSPGGYTMPEGRPQRFKPDKPHVLWIDVDTLRADYMSCHGYKKPTTPFLDEWVKQSVVFDHAVSDGIWTTSSHASMFTGMSVRQHGVDWANLWLDDRFTTIAERLRDAGYNTAFFSSNPWLTEKTNLLQGFDFLRKVFYVRRLGLFSGDYMSELLGFPPPLPWLDADYGAALTQHWIGDWLDDQADSENPMFLFVHYMEVHLPYAAPARYRRRFMTDEQVARSCDIAEGSYGNIVAMPFHYTTGKPLPLVEEDYDVLRLQYEACIRYIDDRIRELIEQFERRGLLEDTLVVINSDHGEYLGTHGMWGHLAQTFHDVAHVTLILREPRGTGYKPVSPPDGTGYEPVRTGDLGIRKAGLRVATPVQHSDLYGTILNATLGPVAQPPSAVSATPPRSAVSLAPPSAAPPLPLRERDGVRVSTASQPFSTTNVAPPPTAVSTTETAPNERPNVATRDLFELAATTGVPAPVASGVSLDVEAAQPPGLRDAGRYPVASGVPAGRPTNNQPLTLIPTDSRLAVIQCTTDEGVRPVLETHDDPALRRRAVGQRAILDGRFKLIVSDDGRRELYDLQDDPRELRDVSEAHPDVTKRLSEELTNFEARVPAYAPNTKDGSPALDNQTLDALRSLGYIGCDN